MSKVRVYIGTDKKIHFVDSEGADSALPFSSGGITSGKCSYLSDNEAYIDMTDIKDAKAIIIQSPGLSGSSYQGFFAYIKNIGVLGFAQTVQGTFSMSLTYSFPNNNRFVVLGRHNNAFIWRGVAGAQSLNYWVVM